MSNSKKVGLPSGAELVITPAPFADAKALYQAVLEELKSLKLNPQDDVDVNLLKDLICAGFGSKKIELALSKCFQRATYNGLKVTDDTWEPVEARQDYLQACLEVAKENLLPFVKSLSAEFSTVFRAITGDHALRQETNPS